MTSRASQGQDGVSCETFSRQQVQTSGILSRNPVLFGEWEYGVYACYLIGARWEGGRKGCCFCGGGGIRRSNHDLDLSVLMGGYHLSRRYQCLSRNIGISENARKRCSLIRALDHQCSICYITFLEVTNHRTLLYLLILKRAIIHRLWAEDISGPCWPLTWREPSDSIIEERIIESNVCIWSQIENGDTCLPARHASRSLTKQEVAKSAFCDWRSNGQGSIDC